MSAWWSGAAAEFLSADPALLCHHLAEANARRFRVNEATQLRAWETSIRLIRDALAALPDVTGWRVLLEYPLLRLGRRIDAVLLCDRAILVFEFRADAAGF